MYLLVEPKLVAVEESHLAHLLLNWLPRNSFLVRLPICILRFSHEHEARTLEPHRYKDKMSVLISQEWRFLHLRLSAAPSPSQLLCVLNLPVVAFY